MFAVRRQQARYRGWRFSHQGTRIAHPMFFTYVPDLARLSAGLESEDEPVRQHSRLSYIPRVVPPVRLHEEYATCLLSVSLQFFPPPRGTKRPNASLPFFLQSSRVPTTAPYEFTTSLCPRRTPKRRPSCVELGCGDTEDHTQQSIEPNVDDDHHPPFFPLPIIGRDVHTPIFLSITQSV